MKAQDQRARSQAVPDRIGPDDPRYAALVGRGFNKRFAGKPDYVRLVHSADDVIDAVQDAVREGRRVVARGGGHCLEGFVDDPDVRVIIDTSLMTGVRFDPGRGAFEIDAGTTLGEAYRRLFLGWGVTIPAGESPYLGLGAHVSGGGFGFLCRQHGLAADHLYGLEVVSVDADGAARKEIATREPGDPNRDLWWAHTGAGGGNFGIVTDTGGVPWHTLYFKSNYAALQRVKRRWDPRNVFHRALSIRP
jgi:aclacinomycin oxidase